MEEAESSNLPETAANAQTLAGELHWAAEMDWCLWGGFHPPGSAGASWRSSTDQRTVGRAAPSRTTKQILRSGSWASPGVSAFPNAQTSWRPRNDQNVKAYKTHMWLLLSQLCYDYMWDVLSAVWMRYLSPPPPTWSSAAEEHLIWTFNVAFLTLEMSSRAANRSLAQSNELRKHRGPMTSLMEDRSYESKQ